MTATMTSLARGLPTTTVLRRAAGAEWVRLRTLRSTWLAVLAGGFLLVFIGAAAALGHDGPDRAPIWVPAQLGIAAGQFAFLLAVLLSVTGEYATGAIRSSLQWVPRRSVLFAVRVVVPVAFATASAVVSAAVAWLAAWGILGPAAEVVAGDLVASLGRIALVVAFGGILTAGFGLLLRSTAGTLTLIFLLVLVLPIALGNTNVPALITISDHLPGRAIVSVLVVDEMELAGSTISWVMSTWSGVALVAGGWSLLRRDTT